MNKHSSIPFLLLALVVLTAPACSGSGEPDAAAPAGSAARDASTLPIPDDANAADLPAGHPPIGDAGSGAGAGAATSGVTWKVPDGWTSTPPNSTMRVAQYTVPGSLGEGECVVYYFGPGQGGDPMANARRWAGQFEQPDGSSSEDRMVIETVEGAALPTQLVSVTGTYDGGMTMTAAPPEARAGHMLLGGIVDGPDAPWFFKFTGPESTVRQNRDAFVGMLKSVHTED